MPERVNAKLSPSITSAPRRESRVRPAPPAAPQDVPAESEDVVRSIGSPGAAEQTKSAIPPTFIELAASLAADPLLNVTGDDPARALLAALGSRFAEVFGGERRDADSLTALFRLVGALPDSPVDRVLGRAMPRSMAAMIARLLDLGPEAFVPLVADGATKEETERSFQPPRGFLQRSRPRPRGERARCARTDFTSPNGRPNPGLRRRCVS
ncbi:MAG: hypothetical protein M5R36_29115 [Deltaproteobacteria bacterium]|nr:hypothetical protein [Deltaproteobacteria bacterium]